MKKKIFYALFCLLLISFSAILISPQEVIFVDEVENFEGDKYTLDKHKDKFKADPTLTIYLISSSTKKDKKDAFIRINKVKNYLLNELKISNRIVIFYQNDPSNRRVRFNLAFVRPEIFTYKIEDGWEGILPINTSKTQVNKILGKPIEGFKRKNVYFLDGVNVIANYTSGICETHQPEKENNKIPNETLFAYKVKFAHPFNLSLLNFKREKYVRELKDNNEIIIDDKTDSGDPYIHKETAFYYNKEDGITIGVDEQRGIEYVLAIYYRPNSIVAKSLKCGN